MAANFRRSGRTRYQFYSACRRRTDASARRHRDCSKKPRILFPIFTNGTYIDERHFKLFDKSRNLLPILSIEGNRELTDTRRGKGIYDRLIANMDEMKRRGLIFGASVTVTTQNIKEVTSDSF